MLLYPERLTVSKSVRLTLKGHSGASRVAQQSKALHGSARGITTDPGLIPGCVTAGRDLETHEVAHNWPSVVWFREGFGRLGFPCPITL